MLTSYLITKVFFRLTYWDNVYSVIQAKKQNDSSTNCDTVKCDADIENLADDVTTKCAVRAGA